MSGLGSLMNSLTEKTEILNFTKDMDLDQGTKRLWIVSYYLYRAIKLIVLLIATKALGMQLLSLF